MTDPNIRALLEAENAAAGSNGQGVQVSVSGLAKLLRLQSDSGALATVDSATVFGTRRVRESQVLFRAGDAFHSLYVVRAGFFKTVMFDAQGAEQVLSFPMQSDLMGADGIASGCYASEAIALQDSEVIIVPFGALTALSREAPAFERVLYSLISRELVRDQGMLYVIGMLGAEGRVAAFLLNLAERFGALGYSRTCYNLRMTRQEIGSYLGLKLETVSRALSAFDAAGYIKVHLKQIELLDSVGLRRAMEDTHLTTAKSGTTERGKPDQPIFGTGRTRVTVSPATKQT